MEWQLERGGLHPDTQLDAPKVNEERQVYVFAAINKNAFSNAGRPSRECEGRLVFWELFELFEGRLPCPSTCAQNFEPCCHA